MTTPVLLSLNPKIRKPRRNPGATLCRSIRPPRPRLALSLRLLLIFSRPSALEIFVKVQAFIAEAFAKVC
jgi:hypothetical protein